MQPNEDKPMLDENLPETQMQQLSTDAVAEPPAPPPPADTRGAKERFYDKIPLTYKQVDILVKVLVVVMVGLIIIGVLTGNRF